MLRLAASPLDDDDDNVSFVRHANEWVVERCVVVVIIIINITVDVKSYYVIRPKRHTLIYR